MNRTLMKSILRLIRQTLGRFLSLTAIVTIGVAFFVGVSASSPIMGYSVDQYDDERGLKDITIYSDYGFDAEDVEAVRKNPYVLAAEGTYFADAVGVYEQVSVITRIHAWNPDSTINQFVLREGRLPEKKNEALSEAGTELEQGFPIGSEVELVIPDDDGSSALQVRKVTIVGTIDTPVYLNMTKENSTLSNQYIETYLYVPEDAFSHDYYLEMNILLKDSAPLNAFTDAYETYAEEAAASLKELAKTQKDVRIDRIKKDALEEYEDGLKEYEDGKKEFEEGIADAEDEIKNGQDEIDNEKLKDVIKKAQLNDFTDSLPDGLETQIGESGAKISGGQKQRIAIARALYFNPEILILDEATSALDNDTEKAVMEAIDILKGEKTLIIVAHRLSTISKCNHIYEVRDGALTEKKLVDGILTSMDR